MKLAEVYEFDSHTVTSKAGAAICLSNSHEQELVINAVNSMNIAPMTFSPAVSDVRYLRSFELIVADELIAQRLTILFEEHEEEGDGMSPALISVTGVQPSDTLDASSMRTALSQSDTRQPGENFVSTEGSSARSLPALPSRAQPCRISHLYT